MTKHSEGLGLRPEVAAMIDRGWDGPDDDIISVHGDPVAGIPGSVTQHGWDLRVNGATIMSLDQMNEWLQLNRLSVEEFKTYTSYISNVGREGFEWLAEL